MPAKKAPVFGALNRNATLAETSVNAGPVQLDSDVSLKNPDGTGFQGGAFSVKLAKATAQDDLVITERGGIALQVNGESGATEVYYNGARIGTLTSSGQDGTALVVAFDQPVDDAAATALARAVAFAYSGDTPAAAARALTFSVTDAEGTTKSAKMQLKLTPQNDAPVFSGLEPASTRDRADVTAGFVIDADARVLDPDGTTYKGATLNVHVADAGSTDQLYLAPGAFSITGTKLYFNGKVVGTVSADGVSGHDLAFTFQVRGQMGKGALSDAQMSMLLEQVSYRSTASGPLTDAPTVSFTLTDAQKGVAHQDVSFTFTNAAPEFLPASPDGSGIIRLSTGKGSAQPVASPDGTKVAYMSSMAGQRQVFVSNLATGEVTLVSSSDSDTAGNDDSVDKIAFSPDGHKVAFVSDASNLVLGDTNGAKDVFVKDLDTGAITRVSTDSAGGQINTWSQKPVFSPDGTKIAFETPASNLGYVDTNGSSDLFVKDLATGTLTLVSNNAAGSAFGNGSFNPAFSPDGTRIVFMAFGTAVGPGLPGSTAVYVKDLATGDVTFVSYATAHEVLPVFSPDGTKVAFLSYPGEVIPGAVNDSVQLFMKDLATGEVTLVSSDAAGTPGNGLATGEFAFSPDGTRIVFSSMSSNLVAGDTDGVANVFIKDLATGAVTRVEGNVDGASGGAVFTADGAHVVFSSAASGLVAGDGNFASDIFMAALATPSVTSVTLTEDPAQSRLSAIGTVYFSDADTLDAHEVSVSQPQETLGTLSAKVVSDMNGTGAVVWSYAVDESDVAALAAGESRVDTFTLLVSDGAGGTAATTVAVTLVGAGEDAATIATFRLAPDDAAQAPAQKLAHSAGADLWASVAACFGDAGDTLADLLASIETRAFGAAHPQVLAAGAAGAAAHAAFDPGAWDLGFLEQALDRLPAPGAALLDGLWTYALEHGAAAKTVIPHHLADLSEALVADLRSALPVGHDGGHWLI